MSKWGGRKVRRLTLQVLATKGGVCHLCGLPGANSCDHEPPRSELLAAGVTNPDALTYLHPAHLSCNLTRHTRPLTPALRAECRAKMLRSLGQTDPLVEPSPRFAGRRPRFPADPPPTEAIPSPSPRSRQKSPGRTRSRPPGA